MVGPRGRFSNFSVLHIRAEAKLRRVGSWCNREPASMNSHSRIALPQPALCSNGVAVVNSNCYGQASGLPASSPPLTHTQAITTIYGFSL